MGFSTQMAWRSHANSLCEFPENFRDACFDVNRESARRKAGLRFVSEKKPRPSSVEYDTSVTETCREGLMGARRCLKAPRTETEFTPLLPHLPDELAVECLARVADVRQLRGVCRRWSEAVDSSEEFLAARARAGRKGVDWLYVLVCGRDGVYSWHAYDPANSEWHALPAMPERVDFQLTSPGTIGMSYHVQCVSTGRKLVMLSGLKRATGDKVEHQWSPLEPALKNPWVFDPAGRQWKKGRPFATSRRWCVCGVVDSKVYVASGCGLLWNMSLSKSTDVYDPEVDAWEPLPLTLESSKFSGEAITAATVGGNLYVVSGGRVTKVGAMFCSGTRTWSKMPDSLMLGWVGSCVGVDDKFYVVDEWAGKLSVYDTGQSRWTVVLEDHRLKGFSSPTSANGRICGYVKSVSGSSDESSDEAAASYDIRIIDVKADPPIILDLPVPHGRVVSIQVLERMSSSP